MCRLARSRGQSPELRFGVVTTGIKGKKGSWQLGQNESGPEHLACPSASALGRRSFEPGRSGVRERSGSCFLEVGGVSSVFLARASMCGFPRSQRKSSSRVSVREHCGGCEVEVESADFSVVYMLVVGSVGFSVVYRHWEWTHAYATCYTVHFEEDSLFQWTFLWFDLGQRRCSEAGFQRRARGSCGSWQTLGARGRSLWPRSR